MPKWNDCLTFWTGIPGTQREKTQYSTSFLADRSLRKLVGAQSRFRAHHHIYMNDRVSAVFKCGNDKQLKEYGIHCLEISPLFGCDDRVGISVFGIRSVVGVEEEPPVFA